MNIKSLLLGSAAALAVVSGAQAADAVVAAEPEQMEYVKVCDAYGTGFFYIPGTETCLKIGATLRYEKRIKKTGDADSVYDNHGRIRFDVESRNDSEWGTVYSWIRLQGDQVNNGNDAAGSDPAAALKWYYYFGIGGAEFGNWDSQWKKFLGTGFTDDGGIYQSDDDFPDSRQYVSYTAEFGSTKVYVSLDNDADEYYDTSDVGGKIYRGESHSDKDLNDLNRGRKYMPDVTAGVSTEFNDWLVGANVAYDESAESVAVKGVVAGEFGMFGVRALGFWSDSYQNIFFNYDGFSAILGLQATVTDSVILSKDIQFWDNGDWRIVGDAEWKVASGFSVLFEGIYADRYDVKTKQGMLRFQRKF
ncbi:porin [Rhizobium sp. KVB221]|uniref:Porin n=1 Tax=Rhizobium setariae TaxID=2801340 RepID=A0A936YLW8_9HYPH|nr:porin [Rhizobium setariae]MBL0371147.1 porin [Rhizobium setariae]